MTKKISFISAVLLLCVISINAQSLDWDKKALFYNESGTLTITNTAYIGDYSIQLWSDPPLGEARQFIEQDISLSGKPQDIEITFSFDEKVFDYVLDDEFAAEVIRLKIENPDEQKLVKNELFYKTFDLLIFKARLYYNEDLILESNPIKVAISF